MGSAPFASQTYFVLSFLLLFRFPLHSAEEHPEHCPQFFECGNLTNITYPFSLTTQPECGLSMIDCAFNKPWIKFTEGGISYEVKAIFDKNHTIVIHDHGVTYNLQHYNCSLLYNFTTLVSTSLSFEVKSPNLTLFKCKRQFLTSYQRFFNVFHSYLYCFDYDLFYYSDSKHDLPSASPPKSLPVPDHCQVIQFPVHESLPPFNWTSPPDVLFHLLDAGFSLQWNLPQECLKCEAKGIHCLREPTGGFRCTDSENGIERNNYKVKKLVTGLGAGAGGIILTCLLFYIFGRCKKHHFAFSSLLFQNSSISLKTDPEKGSAYYGVHVFTYDELEEATNNFDSSKVLGDGAFGTVYHGKLWDGRFVAVKRLYENNYNRVEQFMNEVKILTLLRHQNLVSLYGCTSRHSRELLLVYEFIPNGTVADHLHGDCAKAHLIPWPIRLSIAIESASALAYLHASDIIHRDIKTNNILLDNNFHVKVADFGLSRLFPTDITHISTAPQGTPGYVDPEYYQCYQLTDKSDVYSFGVVLIELISSKPAIDINRHRREINLSNMAINKIYNRALHELVDPFLGFESDYTVRRMIELVAELAFRCLQQEKEMRPSMVEVLEILTGIESEEYRLEKAESVDIPADNVVLLKNTPPLSPDSMG